MDGILLCNCLFSQAGRTDEILHLSLQETYCLPILLYASPGYSFKKQQLSELNACWNSTYCKIYNFNQWESVKCFINGLGRLDLHHIILLQRLKFYKRLSISSINLMKDLFWHFYIDNAQLESHIRLICCSLRRLMSLCVMILTVYVLACDSS